MCINEPAVLVVLVIFSLMVYLAVTELLTVLFCLICICIIKTLVANLALMKPAEHLFPFTMADCFIPANYNFLNTTQLSYPSN